MHTYSLVPGPSAISWCRGGKAVLSTPALITSGWPGNEANIHLQCSEWTWLHQVILNRACLSRVNEGSHPSLVVLSFFFADKCEEIFLSKEKTSLESGGRREEKDHPAAALQHTSTYSRLGSNGPCFLGAVYTEGPLLGQSQP